MSRILKVSQGDYRVQVQSGGSITLDTGSNAGTVVITGNLDVQGTTTTVESTVTTVKDNIIQLNYGQTGNGISSALGYKSGIQIGRGNWDDAQFVFDDNVTHYDQITDTDINGTFVLRTMDGILSGLQVQTITIDGLTDLNFDLKETSKVLKLANTDPTSYANLLLETGAERDNAIPNKKFVSLYIQSGVVTPGMADVDKIYKTVSSVEKSRVQAYAYSIDFTINSNLAAQITNTGMTINNINIVNDTVSNTLGTMIIAAASNLVTVNSVLGLTDQVSTPSYTAGQNKLYSTATLGPGKSGVFFTNINYADELVAKNRALLFSMLF